MFIAVVVVRGELRRRHALRGARSAHQVRRTEADGRSPNHDARTGPGRRQRRRGAGARRCVPGAPLSAGRGRRGRSWPLFVFAALFAGFDHRRSIRSPPMPRRRSRRRARAHWLGADFMGRDVYSRIVYGARISLAVGLGSTALGCLFGVALGPAVGLSRRLGRPAGAAPHRHPAGAAAAGAGAGDGGGARAVAAEHHHRDRHPADPLRGARHPLQHAGAARAAVRRGGAGRSA